MANKKGGLNNVLGNVAKGVVKSSKTTQKSTTTKKKKEDEKKKTVQKQSDPRAKTESRVLSPREKAQQKKDYQKSLTNAYSSYKKDDKNALGVKAQTQKSGNKNTMASNIEKVGTRAAVTGDTKKEVNKSKDLKNLSKAEKQQVIRNYVRSQDWNKIDKQIEKSHDTRVKSKDLSAEDYLRIQNATRMPNQKATFGALGGGNGLEDIGSKVASRNALDYGKGGISAGAQEFMNASSVDPTNLYDGYNYTQAQKNAIQQGKNSTAGRIGYMAGIGASAMFGGVTGMEGAVGKLLYKQGGKSAVKRFLAERGADMIINSGVDALDSVKSATDMDGNIDWSQAGKNMLLNEAMNIGVGGAMGGVGLGLKKVQVTKAIKLKTKLEKGLPLDKADRKLMAKINQNQLDDEYEFVNQAMRQTQTADKNAKAMQKYANDPNVTSSIGNNVGNKAYGSDIPFVENQQRMRELNSNIDAYGRAVSNATPEEQGRLFDQYVKDYEELKTREGYKPSDMKKLADKESDALAVKIQNGTATDEEFERFGELVERMRELDKQIPKKSPTLKKTETMEGKYVAKNRKTAGVKAKKKGNDYNVVRKEGGTVKPEVTNPGADGRFKKASNGETTTKKLARKPSEDVSRYEELLKEQKQLKADAKSGKGNPYEVETRIEDIDDELKKLFPNRKAFNKAKKEGSTTRYKGKPKKGVVKATKSTRDIKRLKKTASFDEVKDATRVKREAEARLDEFAKLKKDEIDIEELKKTVDDASYGTTMSNIERYNAYDKEADEIGKKIEDGTYTDADIERFGVLVDRMKDIKKNSLGKLDKAALKDVPKMREKYDVKPTRKLAKEEEVKPTIKPKRLQKASGTYIGNVDKKLERAEAKRYEGKAKRLGEVAEEPKAEPPKAETKPVEEPKPTKVEEPKAEKPVETPKAEEPKAETPTEPKAETKPEDFTGTPKEKSKKFDESMDAKFKEGEEISNEELLKRMKDKKAYGSKVTKLIKGKDLSNTYKRFAKWCLENAKDKEKAFDMLSDMKAAGEGGKKVYTRMEEAVTRAEGRVKDNFDEVYNDVINAKNNTDGSLAYDPYTYRAETQELLNTLIDNFNKSGSIDDLEKIRKLAAHNIETGSQAGHSLNACKLILRETPEGRYQLAEAELRRLNKKFADRLDKPLELTDDEILSVLNAVKPEEVDKAFKQINERLWSDIPSTAMEKFNEWRHFTMLANFKTHARNVAGNGVFAVARTMSNAIEIGLAKAITKSGKVGDNALDMASVVTRKDLKDNKKLLDEQWSKWYDNTDSQNRYIESVRPQGMTEIRNKPISKMVQFNYDWLEKEDRWFLKPAFERSFMRYCKSNKIDLAKADPKVLEKASKYAEKQALYATYRDVSELSSLLTGLKQKTAGKKGKTAIGTAGYRVGNMVLESALPFVKTPVNVFGRMVDYSPMGLMKSLANLHSFAKKGDYDRLADGIHYLATGLTGSGVTLLGVGLAHQGLLMTKAGAVSGDAFYDRDMGYQDYSLVLPDGVPLFGGKSYSIDWVAPMSTSLFMGASVYESLADKGHSYKDIINGAGAMVNPMLEMSFMSGSKDMIETFMENAIDRSNGETHWAEATFNAVFGSVPQNYLQSMMTAQIVGQTAQGMDKYQRDTSSTREDPIAKSWESFIRKNMNKTPFLRQMLNKKVDRQGRDVQTFGGDNLVTRWMNAILNPSTTKKITFNETDKQLIDIYKHMPEDTKAQKTEKQYFFYNFTGNPQYDLVDGRRMTYKEKYEYTKENRVQQNRMVNEMIRDPGYKDMTYDMKAKEVGDTHWVANTISDRKTYGDKYAVQGILKGAKVKEQEGYNNFKAGGGSDKDYVSFYITKEKLIAQTHDSDYYTKALATAIYDAIRPGEGTRAARAFDIHGEKVEAAKEYLASGGDAKEYITASRRIIGGIDKFGDSVSVSIKNKAVSQGSYEDGTFKNRTLNAMGIDTKDTNMGIGLSKKFDTKYTVETLTTMKAQMQMQYGDTKGETVEKYINSLGLANEQEKACLFHYFSGNKRNPFGDIPNWCKGEDPNGTGGRGRRGWGHRRRGHRGGSGGGAYETFDAYMKRMYGSSGSSSSATTGSKSNLTEAFRREQLKKLRKTSASTK